MLAAQLCLQVDLTLFPDDTGYVLLESGHARQQGWVVEFQSADHPVLLRECLDVD